MTHRSARTAAVLALILLCGCSAPLGTGLPITPVGVPFPLDRETSDLTEYILAGSAAESRSAGAVEQGTALELLSAAGGFEFALYRFNPGSEAPDSVSVMLEEASTSAAWLGLANFAEGRWIFDGPFAKQKTLSADDPAFISPAGNIWVAVVTTQNENALVNALSVRTISPANLPPVADVVADVTTGDAPLSVQFDASASTDEDSPIIEYAWDFDGNGSYEEFTDTPLLSHVYTTAGPRTVKLRVTDDQFARATDTIDIEVNVAGNNLPFAAYNVFPTSGAAPLQVSFDASFSNDSDGFVVLYEWDWDGDGVYDQSGTAAQTVHTYVTPGAFSARLRVRDEDGAASSNLQPTTITANGWAGVTVPSSSPCGLYISLADVSGRPAIAQNINGRLYFSRALNANGTSWGNTMALDGSATPESTSLAMVNGNPAVAYYDSFQGDLLYVRATDPTGGAWSFPITIDSVGNQGDHCCLAVVNGRPAISYAEGPGDGLKYVRASNPDGSGWGSPTEIDSGAFLGSPSSLVVINGRPAIAYANGASEVKYKRANDVDGLAWGGSILIASSSVSNCSLAVANGNPAISYVQGTSGLLFKRATDPDGLAWGSAVSIDPAGSITGETSLVADGSTLYLSYMNKSSDLMYVESIDSSGSAWEAPSTLHSLGDVGQYNSLALFGGKPAIAYTGFDAGSTDAQFMKLY